MARGRTKAASAQHATGGRKSSTDLYKGGNYYIPKTAPNSPRDSQPTVDRERVAVIPLIQVRESLHDSCGVGVMEIFFHRFVSHIHVLLLGPSFSRPTFSCPVISNVLHFYVLYFQSTQCLRPGSMHAHTHRRTDNANTSCSSLT